MKRFTSVLFAVCFVVVCSVGGWLVATRAIVLDEKRSEEGYRDYHFGIPANANPYAGDNYHAARLWLNGWTKAKIEDDAKK